MTYQSTVKIFIDDIRLPPEEYDVCFKKISDFSEYLENITSITIIDRISLDYDFDYTDITQTGYDGLVLLIGKIKKTDLIPEILSRDATVIVTIGAGDIGAMVHDIKTALNEKV